MAGYMYLGSQKVCPAILLGGGSGEEPTLTFPLTTNENGEMIADTNFVLKTGSSVKEIPEMFFNAYWAYINRFFNYNDWGHPEIVGADFSSIERITGGGCLQEAFAYSGIRYIDFKNLKSISGGYAFINLCYKCNYLETINFDSLEEITGENAFGGAFSGIVLLESLSFPSLKANGFGSKTSQFDRMLDEGDTITLHFPSNLSSVIPTLDGYPNFGGTNTVILYDLPSTEGA